MDLSESEEEADDPIGKLSMVEEMDLYEPMIPGLHGSRIVSD